MRASQQSPNGAPPRTGSLLARTNFVLGWSAVAIAVTAIIAMDVFVISPITERSADDEAGLLVLSAQTWVELPDYTDARPAFELEMMRMHDLIISSDIRDLPLAGPDNDYYALLRTRLTQRLGAPVRLLESDDLLWAEMQLPAGELQVGFSPRQRDVQPLYVALIIGVMGAAIVIGTSYFIVRRIARPLEETANAVEAFRGAEGFSPLPEKGPRELVTLAMSFNRMAREISELLSNRTTLLAGISHDLRTPLARMRLALELLPDGVEPKLIQRMENNLERMDELIGDTLRFARGAGEVPQEIMLKPFIESLLDDDIPIEWRGDESLRVSIAAGAFERVMANLIANAEQHAADARVVVVVGSGVAIHVVDRGPGIPTEDRNRVFQPFFRLDSSRSQETGGSGLGLAITQQLCQAHGWRVSLREAPGGGTDACVLFPSSIQTDTKKLSAETPLKQPSKIIVSS